MTTVTFKTSSGGTNTNFNAVNIIPTYDTDHEIFAAVDGTRTKKVINKWKVWTIFLSILSETEMDYLEGLAAEEAPQMILSSTTYDITVEDLKATPRGGSIVVKNRDAE